jgi:hypothetical protein
VELDALPEDCIPKKTKEVVALYSNAMLTRAQAIQLLQLYRIRHRVTDAAFEDLLEILQRTILPSNNKLPRLNITKSMELSRHFLVI